MKICIINNLYRPYVRGGAELIVSRIAENLRDNLHHVSVISTKPYEGLGSFKTEHVTVADVPVYRFFPANIYYYMNDFRYPGILRLIWHFLDIFNLHSYFVVKKILLKEKPEVVITHNLMGIGFLIPLLLRKLKIKHIHTVHDVQLYAPSGIIIKGKENNWQQKVANMLGYPSLMKKLMGSPKVIVSPSRFLLDFYKSKNYFPKSQFEVLRNSTDIKATVAHHPAKELRLVFLGQISQPKGVLQLIDVIKNFSRDGLTLKIIGLGPDLRKALEISKGNEKISFYGWRSRQDILDLLGQSDILVMPSICYENSPTVILEALSFGIPVITSDIGGAGEIIKDDYNGWKFEAGNWKQLDNILHRIVADKSILEGMSENCKSSVENITIEQYIKDLVKLIG